MKDDYGTKLYQYFETQFGNIVQACNWVHMIQHEKGGKVEGFGSFDWRTLAATVSLYLEGRPFPEHGPPYYLSTEYGSKLYTAIATGEVEEKETDLKAICELVVDLTRLRMEEVPHLCIENYAPELFGKLLVEFKNSR
jgi:hypothetical protein